MLLRLTRKLERVPDWEIDHALTPLVALPWRMDVPLPNELTISRLCCTGRDLAIDELWGAHRRSGVHAGRPTRRLCRGSP